MRNYKNSIVCLCVLNEEDSIELMIDQIIKEGFQVIVSDGGSDDKSLKIAQSKPITLLHRPGKGKGYGMKQAMQYAFKHGKEYIVFIDCDLTYPTNRIGDLLLAAQDADISIGVRDPKNMSKKSRFFNWTLKIMVRLLYGKKLKDTASGFRAMRIESYINQLEGNGMVLELEISSMSLKKNYIIKEVDVDYYERIGTSKLAFRHYLDAAYTLLATKYRKY